MELKGKEGSLPKQVPLIYIESDRQTKELWRIPPP